MKLPFIPKSKDDSEYYTVIDLGTTHIKAAVYKESSDFAERRMLGMAMQPHGANSMKWGRINDLDLVGETLSLVLEEANLKSGLSTPQTVFGLSGDTVYAKGIRVRVHREKPEVMLDDKEFNMIANHIEKETLTKAGEAVADKIGGKYERVETSFTAYYMDGAKVKTPLGLTGSELEIAVLHYFIETEKLRSINSLASQLKLEIVSLVNTAVHSAAGIIPRHPDFCLIDLGGDLTEVIVVRGGKVVDQILHFMGGLDFTKQIEADMEITFAEAESIKKEYSQGHLDQDRAVTLENSINEVLEWWVEGLAASLKQTKLDEIPNKFILAGESRNLAPVKTSILAYPWNKTISLAGFPEVEILNGRHPNLDNLADLEI